MNAFLVAYMALNGVDLAQTMSCAGAQTCREANRLFAPLLTHPATFGALKIGLDSAAVAGILHLRKDHPKVAWVLVGVGIAAEGAATLHNARRLR